MWVCRWSWTRFHHPSSPRSKKIKVIWKEREEERRKGWELKESAYKLDFLLIQRTRKEILGGSLLRRIPQLSNSFSSNGLTKGHEKKKWWVYRRERGIKKGEGQTSTSLVKINHVMCVLHTTHRCSSALAESSIIRIRSAVRATAITWRPRPFPSCAPSTIPGKSRSWTLAPLYYSRKDGASRKGARIIASKVLEESIIMSSTNSYSLSPTSLCGLNEPRCCQEYR